MRIGTAVRLLLTFAVVGLAMPAPAQETTLIFATVNPPCGASGYVFMAKKMGVALACGAPGAGRILRRGAKQGFRCLLGPDCRADQGRAEERFEAHRGEPEPGAAEEMAGGHHPRRRRVGQIHAAREKSAWGLPGNSAKNKGWKLDLRKRAALRSLDQSGICRVSEPTIRPSCRYEAAFQPAYRERSVPTSD